MDESETDATAVRAITALWLGVDEAEVAYIDDQYLAEVDEAIDDEPGDMEEFGSALISSLYYNRPALLTSGGVRYCFYFRDCTSAPRRRIRLDSIFRTIPAGSCGAFAKYKMFYS